MSFPRNGRRQGASFHNDLRSSFNKNNSNQHNRSNNCFLNGMPRKFREQPIYNFRINEDINPLKRRKFSSSEDGQRYYQQPNIIGNAPSTSTNSSAPSTRPDVNGCTLTGHKRDRSKIDEEIVFFSRDEIERLSPSRKDGIDSLRETFLRFSYCSFLQHLGTRLDLPQTTVGTAMVLCHRFFVRRSHASHDRFVIATAALFLSAKSEETPCPLNSVLRASYEICYKQDLSFFPYLLPVDWFEQYRERVIEAEHVILTTLDFELNVQHPYVPLTSVLNKLGLSQTVLTNLALNLVSEGIFTRIACSPVYILSWRIDMLFLEKFCFTSEVELLMCCGYIFHETPFSSLSLVIGVAADVSEPLLHFTYLHFVFVLVDFYSSLVEIISLSNIADPTLTLKLIWTTWIILGSGHKTKIMFESTLKPSAIFCGALILTSTVGKQQFGWMI